MLDLSNDMIFRSHYPAKMLTPDAFAELSFSVSDATAYYQYYENIQFLQSIENNKSILDEPRCVELALNAVIAANCLKPQMPKSWFFTQQPMLFIPSVGNIVETYSQETNERIFLLVVEPSDSASLCLIAHPKIEISGKIFYLSDPIKVMNDRLVPLNRTSTKRENDSTNPIYKVC